MINIKNKRFEHIRNRLTQELIYYLDYCYEEELDLYGLEDLLHHIVDVYQVQYGEITLLWDELLFLTDHVYSFDIFDTNSDEIYETITRTLILMETIDQRALELI